MIAEAFEHHMQILTRLLPDERHRRMSAFHQVVSARYRYGVGAMTAFEAAQISSDGRTRALVVGHVMGWERFFLQSAGELLTGVKKPRMFGLTGYLEPDGQLLDFKTVDEFNAYQAEKQAGLPWERIQSAALQTSAALLVMFTHPDLLSPGVLEAARPTVWRLPSGEQIPTTYGWRLWKTVLEHEGFEHGHDLGLVDMLDILEKEIL